ncbi:hypothetical protein AVEN_2851-1 [Araneus ventricosus]|uniref:Uncharacterized protein n=1 Tax=Araneus ventricosus TaxID=182803 RepID=A0A4Y2DW76_ARAVE|nr:hypothetical protein AVEN_2851-1 [Araneus ventricosus]
MLVFEKVRQDFLLSDHKFTITFTKRHELRLYGVAPTMSAQIQQRSGCGLLAFSPVPIQRLLPKEEDFSYPVILCDTESSVYLLPTSL